MGSLELRWGAAALWGSAAGGAWPGVVAAGGTARVGSLELRWGAAALWGSAAGGAAGSVVMGCVGAVAGGAVRAGSAELP
ncbi:hypothetical protein AB0D08_30185 [Kitasatospora sp. NPDC048540]|uniref:hypothetical protein n=1 Tax=Kitasatospora sp. NPDC048540 TaxID=3155634 RepID=UPI0033C4D867